MLDERRSTSIAWKRKGSSEPVAGGAAAGASLRGGGVEAWGAGNGAGAASETRDSGRRVASAVGFGVSAGSALADGCLAGADFAGAGFAAAGFVDACRGVSGRADVFVAAFSLIAAGFAAALPFVGAGAPVLAVRFVGGAGGVGLLRAETGAACAAGALRDRGLAGSPLRAAAGASTAAAAAFGGADGFREAFGAFGLPESRFAISVPPKIAAFVRYENDPLFDLSILGRRSGGRQEKDERLPSGERHGRLF